MSVLFSFDSLSKTTKLLLLDSLLQEVCISSGFDMVAHLWVLSGWVSVFVSHKPCLCRAKESLLKHWWNMTRNPVHWLLIFLIHSYSPHFTLCSIISSYVGNVTKTLVITNYLPLLSHCIFKILASLYIICIPSLLVFKMSNLCVKYGEEN